ncbi:MAG: 3-hydroxyacyl-CoA dehydrogenase NAD-binding domain-containing protein, partial [Vampirovibrionia bacterium]
MKTIGIIGASLIGTGITYNLIMADFTIYLIDISNDKLGKAIHNIKLHLEEATKADLINQDDIKKKLNSIKSSTKLEDIPANIDLVIECVPEDINIKTSVFNTLDKVCNKNTIFATNTSSISVTKLSKSTTRPDKFIGIHFIPPTETNELIELIPIETTSKETLSIIEKFAERIEKITIISKDSPGFCLNRFLLPILNEAAILVDTNKYRNEIYTINYALKDAFKAPSGPFEIMNAIGTTYTYKASNELAQELGDFYRPCEFLKEQAQNNTLWDLPEINKYKDMEAAAFHDTPEIKKMFQGIVFGVCTKLVEEKIASITDINLAAKIGLGWQYGPFEAINDYGPSKTAYLIEEYANNNIYLPVVKNIEDIDNWPIYTTKYYTENNTSFIKLNRPDKTNSINKSLLIELNKHLNTAISDENSKVIVITGSPGCFSTGIDTDYFITSLRRNRIEDITNFIKLAQSTFNKIAESTKPIIALVDCITHSAGLELAQSCHFIISTESSTF